MQAGQREPFDSLLSSLGQPTASGDVKLCYVTRTLANEFWAFERDGFEGEAKRLGVKYQTYAVTNEASITEQLDKAKAILNQGCSAILASPITATALDSVFATALDKHMPVIVLNDARSTLPGTVYVGPDAQVLGATAADYVHKRLPDGGKVAMISGDPGSSNAVNRGKGFVAELKKYPNLELVASQTAMWDQTKAQEIATTMLTAHKDLKAIYCQNDVMALGAIQAVAAAGLTGKVLVIGNDGIPEAKKQITAGNMTATVSERPITEGKAGVDAALWLLAGKQVPAWIDVPGFVIDSTNVAEYANGMP
ncbi:MAG: substrate-binding domain-containing protein [Acidothermus cellulolyticus]|nr:substrate-binding domain-containing protein [Acidothermus cellulolyticus]